jgi:hypothetical protein
MNARAITRRALDQGGGIVMLEHFEPQNPDLRLAEQD